MRWAAGALAVVALTASRPLGAQRAVNALTASARADRAWVAQGDSVGILVTLDLAESFHVWPHEPVLPPALARFRPIPTDITPQRLPPRASIECIHWPTPEPVTVQYIGAPLQLLSYTGTVQARVLLRLQPDAEPGRATTVLRVRYQACDERQCYPPADKDVVVRFQVVRPER
jgi:hypothetical protein